MFIDGWHDKHLISDRCFSLLIILWPQTCKHPWWLMNGIFNWQVTGLEILKQKLSEHDSFVSAMTVQPCMGQIHILHASGELFLDRNVLNALAASQIIGKPCGLDWKGVEEFQSRIRFIRFLKQYNFRISSWELGWPWCWRPSRKQKVFCCVIKTPRSFCANFRRKLIAVFSDSLQSMIQLPAKSVLGINANTEWWVGPPRVPNPSWGVVHLFLLEIFGCNFISLQCAWTTDLDLKNVSYFMISYLSQKILRGTSLFCLIRV